MANHNPLRLPETMTKVDIGPYMRGLREHFGLSEQDVSERLHIRHRYIRAIEEGNLDSMPGRAYAKGYVHTYAEFLGLDADQAVEICFGPELVREQQHHFVPEPMKKAGHRLPGYWRPFAALAVVSALAILLGTQVLSLGGNEDFEEASSETVSEVPEDMLAQMRSMVMTQPTNYNCLTERSELGCLLATREWVVIDQLASDRIAVLAQTDYSGLRAQDVPEMVDEDVTESGETEEDAIAEEQKSEAKKEEEKPAPKKEVKEVSKPKTSAKPAPKAKPVEAKKPEPKPEVKNEEKPKAAESKKPEEEKTVIEKITEKLPDADDLPKPERKFPGDHR